MAASALTKAHEERRKRTGRRVRFGRLITCLYHVPLNNLDNIRPSIGDVMPSETTNDITAGRYYSSGEGHKLAGGKIELYVTWYKPEAYTAD